MTTEEIVNLLNRFMGTIFEEAHGSRNRLSGARNKLRIGHNDSNRLRFTFFSSVSIEDGRANHSFLGPWIFAQTKEIFEPCHDFVSVKPAGEQNDRDESTIVEVIFRETNTEGAQELLKRSLEDLQKLLNDFGDKGNRNAINERIKEYNIELGTAYDEYVQQRCRVGVADRTDVCNPIKSICLTKMEQKIKVLLESNLQIVLTGAPGTGKTYLAREVAKNVAGSEDCIEYVQFHPGYDYSDFVIGMKPVLVDESGKEVEQGESENGKLQVSFRWKDGVFKKFADKARKTYDETEDKKNAPKFVFLIDEINRADLSRVFGELFSLLEEGYRYPKNKNGIRLPNGDSFVIPENLYIIGTMNDIDRSVESMDFALRRRFAWYEMRASATMDAILEIMDDGYSGKLKAAMTALNDRISGKTTDGGENIGAFLGPAYELGAAIFAKFAKCNGDFNMLWENHIEIILAEYLRGRRDRNAILLALKDIYDKSVMPDVAN